MNEIRHPLPIHPEAPRTTPLSGLHLRDLLLMAAHDAAEHGFADAAALAHADMIDVMALGARLVQCQLQALTAATRSLQARHLMAAEVFATAQSIAADPRAVGAVGTVVGAMADGELATASAIADTLATFHPVELVDATVALCAATLIALARSAETSVTQIVQWSATDGSETDGAETDGAATDGAATDGAETTAARATVPDPTTTPTTTPTTSPRAARAPYCAREALRGSVDAHTR